MANVPADILRAFRVFALVGVAIALTGCPTSPPPAGASGGNGGQVVDGGVSGTGGRATSNSGGSGAVNGAPDGGAGTGGTLGSGGVSASGGTIGSGGQGQVSGTGGGTGGSTADAGSADTTVVDATPNRDAVLDGTGGNGADAGGGSSDGGTGGSLQILALGDSITVGFNGANAGYRGPLYNLLKKTAPNLLFVGSSTEGSVTTTTNPLPSNQRHNEGHSSYTIRDITNNLDGLDSGTFNQYGGADRNPNGGHWLDGITGGTNARPALYPELILLMIGTNDANDSDRTAVKSRLHALITKITTLRPNSKLIVAQITPSNRPNNVSYNAAVADEVGTFQAAGKQVSTVDMYTKFPSDGFHTDNLHPNDKGFAFMAQQWFDAIVAVVPSLAAP